MKGGNCKPEFSTLRLAVFVCCWLGICPSISAQQRIYGKVLDKNIGSPIVAATVLLESSLFSADRRATTDSEGRFSFVNLSPGRYTIRVSADQFYAEELALFLAPRAQQEVDFELTPQLKITEEINVTARLKLLDETQAATMTTIDREQLLSLPGGRRTQLTDIITPFVSSAVGSHDNLVHLRGNELSLNNFLNGVSFFDNPHQLFTPGLSPDIIQSVNVITGGFPAEFGNRFGGILDIVTRSGFDANGHGSVAVGTGTFLRNNLSFDYGSHNDRFGYFFYGQGFESLRFLNTPEPERYHDFGKGMRSFAQFDYRSGNNDFFRLVLTADGTNFELPNTLEDNLRERDSFERNREQTAMFSWDHTVSGSSAVSSSLYERYVSSRLIPTSDPFSIEASGVRQDLTIGAKSDYSLYLGSRHAIKAGIDLMLLRLREDVAFDPRENEVEIEPFDFRGRNTGGQASLYFQDQLRLFKNFSANLGLRYDQYCLVSNGHAVSPRVNLAYSFPRAHTVLHFAYNRFFAPPPIENLLLSAYLGFQDLPPRISSSHHFETGLSHSVKDRIVLRMTGYWRSDTNSFETTELANTRIFAPTTFAEGKAYGLEFSAQIPEIKPLGLSGHFGYTAQRAFQTGPVSGGFTTEEVFPGERGPAAFDQIHTGVAGLTWREHHSGLWTSAGLEYGSGTPAALLAAEGQESQVRLPQHLVFNLHFGFELFHEHRHPVSLQFSAENLTNRVYAIGKESELTPVQYSPPRFLSGSLRFHF
jgi:outer membrane receptor protein involved in Fe transport